MSAGVNLRTHTHIITHAHVFVHADAGFETHLTVFRSSTFPFFYVRFRDPKLPSETKKSITVSVPGFMTEWKPETTWVMKIVLDRAALREKLFRMESQIRQENNPSKKEKKTVHKGDRRTATYTYLYMCRCKTLGSPIHSHADSKTVFRDAFVDVFMPDLIGMLDRSRKYPPMHHWSELHTSIHTNLLPISRYIFSGHAASYRAFSCPSPT